MRKRSLTSARTSSGVPKGRVRLRVHAAAPEGDSLPNSSFSPAGPCRGGVCTGFKMSKPASMKSGMQGITEPQEWMNVFQGYAGGSSR